jgi:hypothetical protein
MSNERLNKLFNLPDEEDKKQTLSELMDQAKSLDTISKLDLADKELDELAKKASDAFDNLLDLGYNTEPRFSAPIFDAASKMLGHAVAAKLGKIQKQLKQVDQQIKQNQLSPNDNTLKVQATVFDRNKLIEDYNKENDN